MEEDQRSRRPIGRSKGVRSKKRRPRNKGINQYDLNVFSMNYMCILAVKMF